MNGQLRVGDIDRWDPASLRELAHAARIRTEAAESAAQGLNCRAMTCCDTGILIFCVLPAP
jgi:hypothetical protein